MPGRVVTGIFPGLLALMTSLPPTYSEAQVQLSDGPVMQLTLPAGDLGDALNLYSRQAGITVSYEERLVRGIQVPAISGNFRPFEALRRLLSNTQLQAVQMGEGAWLIQDKGEGDMMTLDTINVSTQEHTPRQEIFQTSASLEVVTQERIERFRGTSVGDIFQGISGVIISENRNSGGLDINIRGMQGQGRVPVVIDGSRQETTVYRGYAGVSSRSYIDPDLIGAMRINKGPVMSSEGVGATGGVVSVSTLKASDIIKGDDTSGVRLRVTGIGNSSDTPQAGTYAGYYLPRNAYRSDCRFSIYCTEQYLMPDSFAPEEGMDRPGLFEFNSYAASLANAHRFDWGEFVLAYAKRDQGNYYAGSDGPAPKLVMGEPDKLAWYTETAMSMEGASRFRAEERIPNTQFDSESWLLNGALYLPQDQGLELSYMRYDSRYGEMMPSQIRSFGQARQWLDSEVLNQTYTARYRWQPVDMDSVDLKVNLWHTDAVTTLNTPGVGSVDIEDNTRRTDDYQRWGTDIANSMRFYPLGELILEYGVSAQWEDMDTDTPQSEGFYAGSRSGWRKEYSAFTRLNWQPWADWTFEAGLRYTRFSSKDNNPLPLSTKDPACISDGADGCQDVLYRNRRSGSAPVLSLTWKPLDSLQVYLRHAEALRMPSLFENTSGWSVSPALDIPLKPEHATNQEIGLNYLNNDLFHWGHQLGVKLAYFNNDVKDYLTRTQPNAWEVEQDGLDFFRLRNIDSLSLNGWEVNLNYDTQRWFVELTGTKYTRIQVCNVGSYVRYYCTNWGIQQSYINNMIPPNWHASVHLGVRLFDEKLELGTRATFMGKRNAIPRYNAPTGFNEPVLWHSYNVLDVYTRYAFSDQVSMDLTIDNITDEYYLDALSLGLVPAPGRTARLSLTVEF